MEGTSVWYGLYNLPNDRPLELHYSKPNDFNFGDGGIEESLRLVENYHQICLYGFEPGSFRRHIRIYDAHGIKVDQFLVLLEISPVRISRSYDLALNDQPSVRQIEISNPYDHEKLYKLHSSRTGGVMIKNQSVRMRPNQESNIELNLSGLKGKHVVFINDENGNNEDAFAIHVR